MSVTFFGGKANWASGEYSSPAISFDGRVVAFESSADNLVAGDTNHVVDIFARDQLAELTQTPTVTLTPTVTQTPTRTPTPKPVILVREDFEHDLPTSKWLVHNHWGVSGCDKHKGNQSACVEGRGGLACGDDYHLNEYSWLIYGPFSLAKAGRAELDYWMWLQSEKGKDGLCVLASPNGIRFYGNCYSGGAGPTIAPVEVPAEFGLDGRAGVTLPFFRAAADSGPAAPEAKWKFQKFDLNHVNKIGNLAGDESVWVAFLWISNESVAAANGAFVDDVVLWMTKR